MLKKFTKIVFIFRKAAEEMSPQPTSILLKYLQVTLPLFVIIFMPSILLKLFMVDFLCKIKSLQ